MSERNSEGKATWVVVLGIIVAALGGVAAELLGAGILDKWPIAITVATAFVSISNLVGNYTKSRPAKTMALAEKAKVAGTPDPK